MLFAEPGRSNRRGKAAHYTQIDQGWLGGGAAAVTTGKLVQGQTPDQFSLHPFIGKNLP